MRFFRLDVNKLNSRVLGWGFLNRRPWLDMKDGNCEITLSLKSTSDPHEEIKVLNANGQPLKIELATVSVTKKSCVQRVFSRNKVETESKIRLKFTFTEAETVKIMQGNNVQLLKLNPTVVFPEFIFALKQKLEQNHSEEEIVNFVETGTLFGHTTLHASYWFKKVFTIELSEDLHKDAVKNLRLRKNVTCIQGSSTEKLTDLVKKLNGISLFFLDAHWSGDQSVDWGKSRWAGYPHPTARISDESLSEPGRQLPLLAELETISSQHGAPAFIMIDDWQNLGKKNFGFESEDWSSLSQSQLKDWFDANARTRFHYQTDPNRYLWAMN